MRTTTHAETTCFNRVDGPRFCIRSDDHAVEDCCAHTGEELGELAEAEYYERRDHCTWCKGTGGLLDGKPAHPSLQCEACPVCSHGWQPRPRHAIRPPAPTTIPVPPCGVWGEESGTDVDLAFGLDADALQEPFCACGHVVSRCDRSRVGCSQRSALAVAS